MNRVLCEKPYKYHPHKIPGYSGTKKVSGTVKIGTTPVKRHVRLYETNSGVFIRSQWTDASGNYAFNDLAATFKYTVTSTDYSGQYNDVIAANITPV